jgi:hypothetical protein
MLSAVIIRYDGLAYEFESENAREDCLLTEMSDIVERRFHRIQMVLRLPPAASFPR